MGSLLKAIKNIVGFLTIIPVGMDSNCLKDVGNFMYLFPIIGALIGVLTGLFSLLLFQILPSLLVGIITIGFVLLLTGLHHTDGLLDLGDGLMYQGLPEKKVEIMHDQQTGIGGLMLGLLTILITSFLYLFIKLKHYFSITSRI